MTYQLFEEVVLLEDMPESGLMKGDVATIVEYHAVPDGEDGYSLEIFNVLGDTIAVITLPESAIAPLTENEVFSVRPLVAVQLKSDLIEQSDEANLECATAQGRTLSSYNIGDYYGFHTRYLTANKPHAGIILTHQQPYTVGQQMRRLLKISATLSDRDMKNRLEFLSDW